MMDERLHMFRKALLEAAVVLSVYLLFLAVGVVSGQKTMTVDVMDPKNGATRRCSPVQLGVRITVRGVPMPNVTVSFVLNAWAEGRREFRTVSDINGVATFLATASSGNYTWHASASKPGYPTINSRSNSFSINLSLAVEPLSPSTFLLAISPVDFKARVTDTREQVIESANVTFYVDMASIGFALTGTNGIATLSKNVSSGMHTWFASATKDDEGGISVPTMFQVGAVASYQEGHVSPSPDAVQPAFDPSHEIVTSLGFVMQIWDDSSSRFAYGSRGWRHSY
jgi:hypothetical protein